ncbi:Protein adenylyltransferase SelO [Arenibacter antarcticus]|uniref:Protein nucleotidyltransferase YdiU n=1 Tax=Arenibacter antarcticus TaxID=2040469 RepID=A0ABW5VLF3_9FLAO|nr:YdiU family protein [Arenibacter sp. H213]MCM4166940.1 YdiU family protein [Arenibacter sp. H213]
MKFNIKDTITKELPADPILENFRRPVRECFSYVSPKKTSQPILVHASHVLAKELGISEEYLHSEEFLKVFSGNSILPNTHPYAMCYGGHQFGNWAGQLGDGRAINLFEIEHNDKLWALQLKGAGETPYSRNADGLAVLRSSIREYLCSEAMYHLGVPTTRALSLCKTGDKVLRDILYTGHPEYEKGAVVCRVSPSFLRFGNFEILMARDDKATLKILTDYTIKQFFPQIQAGTKEGYIQFFQEVTNRTLKMLIHWQRVGFVHGVMNTDNMSILGLTIDYGPYGWLEGYDEGWTPNTTDSREKRYRYGNQINIGLWNLYRLASSLFPLVEEIAPLEAILEGYRDAYTQQYQEMMKSKIGLYSEDSSDIELINTLEENLQMTETDMTIFFRNLSSIDKEAVITDDFLAPVMDAFYNPEELDESIRETWKQWFEAYVSRLQKEYISNLERQEKMNAVNPKYVLRNYMAQLAIDAADKGDYSVLEEMYQLILDPYGEQKDAEKWFAKRPDWARNKIGCSMLSCSS